jgi:hypothetical protein
MTHIDVKALHRAVRDSNMSACRKAYAFQAANCLGSASACRAQGKLDSARVFLRLGRDYLSVAMERA